MDGPAQPLGVTSARPAPGDLVALAESYRATVPDQETFDRRYLSALSAMVGDGHPLRTSPDTSVQLLYSVLRGVLTDQGPDATEAECASWGERLGAWGMPDDAYGLVLHAASRTAREIADDAWTSELGSRWAAVHFWVVEHFRAGAARGRAGAQGQGTGQQG